MNVYGIYDLLFLKNVSLINSFEDNNRCEITRDFCQTKWCPVEWWNAWMGVLTVREECVFPFKVKILFIAFIYITISRPIPATYTVLILVSR